jgi:type I restriction enzyme S subunit
LIFLDERIEQRFVAWALQKQVYALMGTKSYTTVDHLSTKQINESLIPLPPYAEQKRIVAKVDELMTLCDELEATQNLRNSIRTSARKSAIDAISTATTPEELDVAWKRISENWLTIADTPESIAALRSLILDLAVRGSLDSSGVSAHQVPINVDLEKLKLDKDKLWKLSTALPEPAQGWSRVPMARLGQWGSGGTPTASRKEYYSNGTIPWAVIGDLNSDVMLTTESLITKKALESSSTKMIPIGAVLVAMYGASIGKSAISGIECCTNQAIAHCVVDEDVITPQYMFLVIKSLKNHLIEMGKGAAQPNISQSVLKHLVIDIPPLSVQKRVIDRTDELLDLCNQLELSLIKRNHLSKKIAGSLANEVAA